MSIQRVNECRICFSPSFLPPSLPPPFPPPSFHFIFSSFYFSPHPLPPFLFFFNSLGLTFISATCSLRLGNTRILHLSGYFSDQISSSNASWLWKKKKKKLVSGKRISSICIKVNILRRKFWLPSPNTAHQWGTGCFVMLASRNHPTSRKSHGKKHSYWFWMWGITFSFQYNRVFQFLKCSENTAR